MRKYWKEPFGRHEWWVYGGEAGPEDPEKVEPTSVERLAKVETEALADLLVAALMLKESRQPIIINVSGGLVQGVALPELPGLEAYVVDWDTEGSDPSEDEYLFETSEGLARVSCYGQASREGVAGETDEAVELFRERFERATLPAVPLAEEQPREEAPGRILHEGESDPPVE